ncbi:hypothetical protein BK026_09030 [Alteromonas sp. V450]|uniref:YIP1 family protein n=1 Tax=Alteromonas sp. V450 TaxID=1912139 RepID=UPI0008FF606F|nr:YIP1 family protein [Alteromonas sp. V450]OJF68924.1 hypothetical protein BK026_09030 [Alteromonas sp. V450]
MAISQSINLLNVYIAPSTSFANTEKLKSATWLSLLTIIGLVFLANTTFFADMTPEWIVEQQMLQMTDLTDGERQQIATYMLESAGYTGMISAIISTVMLVISVLVTSAYFMFIGRREQSLRFKEWFALSVKMQLPIAINLLAFLFILLSTGHPEQPISLLNFASVNQLFVGLQPGHAYYTFAESINVFYLWSILIGAYGLHALLGKTMRRSVLIVSVPYLLFFAIWGLSI